MLVKYNHFFQFDLIPRVKYAEVLNSFKGIELVHDWKSSAKQF